MIMEKVEGENKRGREQCFFAVDDHRDVQDFARQKKRKEIREPEHQTRQTDDRNAPENGEIIEFFPIRETI